MFKFRFLPILLLPACLMAIPYETMTIKEGVGTPIKSGQLIKVQYKGWLTDSTLFDDSYARGEPLEFFGCRPSDCRLGPRACWHESR